jgi:DNA-binding transcriptional LysR family regulator
MDADLNELVSFVRVVDAGSFTGAARMLKLPTSTVSRRVRSLEDRLGARLLQRTTRKLNLTDAGHIYYEGAARVVQAVMDTENAVTEMQSEPQGTLRITAPNDIGGDVWAVVNRFLAAYPKVNVEIYTGQRRVDLIEEGFDVAIRGGARPSSTTLVARKIADTRMALFASPDYLRRHGTPECLSDLEHHECIMLSAVTRNGTWMIGPEGKEAPVRVKGRVSLNDFDTARRAACDGLGIVLLTTLFCAADVAQGRLVELMPVHNPVSGALWLVYPSRKHMPARTRAFVDFFAENFRFCAEVEPKL